METSSALVDFCERNSLVDLPHTNASNMELWCFLLLCACTNHWANSPDSGNLSRYGVHCDITIMICKFPHPWLDTNVIVGNIPLKTSNFNQYQGIWTWFLLALYSKPKPDPTNAIMLYFAQPVYVCGESICTIQQEATCRVVHIAVFLWSTITYIADEITTNVITGSTDF